MSAIERFISGTLEVVMEDDGDVWIDAKYPDRTESVPLMRIDVETISNLEAFEILNELIDTYHFSERKYR